MADLRVDLTGRLADLMVGFGANVQPGQIVVVNASLECRELVRAVADRCYRAGALHVEAEYSDPYLKRARIEFGGDDAVGYAPSWAVDRAREIGEHRCATITLLSGADPSVLEGLDQQRLGRDSPPTRKEWLRSIMQQLVNWSIGPGPTPAWAALTHPDLPPDAALDALWTEIGHVCRLDERDPVAAWTERMAALAAVAGRLTDRRFDTLHFEGPGTDLRVGLLPRAVFVAGGVETKAGIPHRPNLPLEEVFTTPDPTRTEGHVRSTKPLDVGGTVVRGLEVRFEGGRAVAIDADSGVEVLRGRAASDDGACRLGEVALVDGDSRIGRLSTVFYETLLDENAASHIALGNGLDFAAGEDTDRVNRSDIHIDFMIGSNEVDVTGVSAAGERVPVLRGGEWRV